MSAVVSSFLGRLRFGFLRRVLFIWARSESIGNSAYQPLLDHQKPIVYVLPARSLSDLLVLDRECVKAGLPRPVLAPREPLDEPESHIFLNRGLAWVGRPDTRGQPPRLLRILSTVEHHPGNEVQLVPVSVFWGQSPDVESSPIKLLFAYNWAVGGRLRKLLAILLHGRKIRVRFGAPMSIRGLVDGSLAGATEFELRIRTDGRAYELLADDDASTRVTHYHPIPAVGGDWEVVVVPLTGMESRVFGNLVTSEPFDPDQATQIGVILADGIDGEFAFEIDWIDACS